MDARTRAYYLHRIVQEEDAARKTNCAEARERHEELAEAYRLRFRFDTLEEASSQTPDCEIHYAV